MKLIVLLFLTAINTFAEVSASKMDLTLDLTELMLTIDHKVETLTLAQKKAGWNLLQVVKSVENDIVEFSSSSKSDFDQNLATLAVNYEKKQEEINLASNVECAIKIISEVTERCTEWAMKSIRNRMTSMTIHLVILNHDKSVLDSTGMPTTWPEGEPRPHERIDDQK